ncbi:MAG: ribosomal protein S18-alanine N-acetyltransferase [Oscillospiraceae bacterium]|nr:ribosomal protein S18-alanine N-acetyltransferase [Oscillospiraceae bacterium]
MRIVPMGPEHIAQVAAMEREYFSAPWDEASLAHELENPLALWLVALDGETVAGYIGSQSVLGESDMMNLAVLPDHRRRGVGTALVERLLWELGEENHCLTLEVRASNEAAIALYDGLGFRQVGRRPKYYLNPPEDALILRKDW